MSGRFAIIRVERILDAKSALAAANQYTAITGGKDPELKVVSVESIEEFNVTRRTGHNVSKKKAE